MRHRAARHPIYAGGCDVADGFQRDAPAGLKRELALRAARVTQPVGLAHVIQLDFVEQHDAELSFSVVVTRSSPIHPRSGRPNGGRLRRVALADPLSDATLHAAHVSIAHRLE